LIIKILKKHCSQRYLEKPCQTPGRVVAQHEDILDNKEHPPGISPGIIVGNDDCLKNNFKTPGSDTWPLTIKIEYPVFIYT